jgi:hypothetical protein
MKGDEGREGGKEGSTQRTKHIYKDSGRDGEECLQALLSLLFFCCCVIFVPRPIFRIGKERRKE